MVWSVLYLLMGISAYLIFRDGNGFEGPAKIPLILYVVNLIINNAWSIIFFKLHKIKLAFIITILLDISNISLLVFYRPINPLASYLLIPYFLWCLFVTYIVYRFKVDNPEKTSYF